MIKNYFKLYDTLTKEFYLSEDKAKELIIAIYESGEEKMMRKHLGIAAIIYEGQQQKQYTRTGRLSESLLIFYYYYIAILVIANLILFFL